MAMLSSARTRQRFEQNYVFDFVAAGATLEWFLLCAVPSSLRVILFWVVVSAMF
jgi:hypothetical protein